MVQPKHLHHPRQSVVFRDRREAGERIAEQLKSREFENPLVIGIPRGGVVVGAAIAERLSVELDLVLARKLRSPFHPELAVGAVNEDGLTYLASEISADLRPSVARERLHQLSEIMRRRRLFRAVRPAAEITGRSIILTDDGIATGSTLIAALQVLTAKNPKQVTVAVPVAPVSCLELAHRYCNDFVCLIESANFSSVGSFYADFNPVPDEDVLELLRNSKGQ